MTTHRYRVHGTTLFLNLPDSSGVYACWRKITAPRHKPFPACIVSSQVLLFIVKVNGACLLLFWCNLVSGPLIGHFWKLSSAASCFFLLELSELHWLCTFYLWACLSRLSLCLVGKITKRPNQLYARSCLCLDYLSVFIQVQINIQKCVSFKISTLHANVTYGMFLLWKSILHWWETRSSPEIVRGPHEEC